MLNSMDINALEIDLEELKNEANAYILRKAMVLAEDYTIKDILLVGLRKMAREKQWQLKHGSTNQTEKMNKLKAALQAQGVDPEAVLNGESQAENGETDTDDDTGLHSK